MSDRMDQVLWQEDPEIHPGYVDHYTVRYTGSGGSPDFPTSISLYHGEERIATVCFIDPGPHSGHNDEEDLMHLPIAMFENLIDILRSESPIYFTWFEHTRTAHLGTSGEPVGEAE